MENAVKLQMNAKQILAIFGAQLYKGDIIEVAGRELLQNSFDAVKKVKDPEIKIRWEYPRDGGFYLEFKDNGCGMTRQTVVDCFFTVGGTFKDQLAAEERSGGFGIAKVQYLMAAESVEITTWRGGICTHAIATQEQLLEDGGVIESYPCESYLHGSKIQLRFPKCDSQGKEIYYNVYRAREVWSRPLIGHEQIKVYVNNNLICPTRPWTHSLEKDTEFGKIQVYFELGASKAAYLVADVFCAGLYQFTERNYVGERCGLHVYMNVLPKYVGGDAKYAFANSRDHFSNFAEAEMKNLNIWDSIKELGELFKARESIKEYEKFQKIQYVDVQANELERTVTGSSNEELPDIAAILSAIGGWDAFFKRVTELRKELSEQKEVNLKVKEENKEELLRYINKDGRITTTRDELMISKVASVVYDCLYEDVIRCYTDYSVDIAGVISSKEERGCFLNLNGKKGIYLNPFGEFGSSNEFANTMMEVLVHELAHSKSMYHDDEFFAATNCVRRNLWRNNLYEKYYAKFLKIWDTTGVMPE
jgi:hypothetical protein